MNRRFMRFLVGINAALLAALWVVGYATEPASAQLGGRGEYVMVSGQATASPDLAAVYLLEMRSQSLAVFTFDSRTNKLDLIDTRQVGSDLLGGGR